MGELVDGNPLFPGENELDQIHCIQKVLGNLTEKQQETFYSNPIYQGKNLLNITKPETLERKYFGKLNKQAINFLKGLLELEPKKRLNENNVFQHPYFAKLVNNDKTMNNEINEKKIININKINTKNDYNDKINVNNTGQSNNQILKIKIIQANHKLNNNNENNVKKGEKNDNNKKVKEVINNINNKSLVMNNINNNNCKQPNITNINIINYNTINENYIQNNCQNVILNNNNNKNINEKMKNNINSIIIKKEENNVNNNKIELNPKENNENQNNNNNINIIDNAYKTFYQKNKEKDIYNIKLNLGDCGSLDSNNIMNNFNYENKYESIKEEEFSTNEKNKIAQVTSLYKNNGQKYINDEKSPGKKYLQKISPSKNYFFNKNLIHSKNNFQLPVILKATAYNNHAIFNHKKYNNFY